jgi:hypothetical protein
VRLVLVWFPTLDLFSILPHVSDFSTPSLPLRLPLKRGLEISFSHPALDSQVSIVFPLASKECRPVFCSSTCQRRFFLPFIFVAKTFLFPATRIFFTFHFSPRWFLLPNIPSFSLGFGRPCPCFDSSHLASIPRPGKSSPVLCFHARPRILSPVGQFLGSDFHPTVLLF